MLVTFARCVCTNVPSLQLPSKFLWLAFPNSLACSRLLAFSVIEAEERDGRRLVAGGIVLLTCHSLLVWLAVHLPGDPMQVSLVRWQMCVQPQNRSLHFPQVTDREGPVCMPCYVSGNTPISLPVYNCSLSFAWHEEVTNFLIAWWTMFWLSTEGGEKGRPWAQSLSASMRLRLAHPDTKMRYFCPKYVCLLSATYDHNIKPCKHKSARFVMISTL